MHISFASIFNAKPVEFHVTNLQHSIFSVSTSFSFPQKKMRKQRFKIFKLFLRLFLLFQIYSLHCLKAESTENSFTESFDKCKYGEETGVNDHIYDKDTESSVVERPKRPARLLPLRMLL